ncbi:MerR family transcriptional regulator [Lactobacillus selangorensis]|uniref:MerR family transcriptional regulator n=1 Tax=Lactobacillus selangorensis TaxID=81857 RepID=UPI00070FE10B|nr:MerR family transcriptional regulator [Lactobacillus selangorensis]
MNSKRASQFLGMTIDTMRYYERIGVIPPVTRDQSGYRDYQIKDLNRLFLAKSLRAAGLSVESLVKYAKLNESVDHPEQAQKEILRQSLDELNQKIEDMENTRAILEHELDTFDDHLAKFHDEDHPIPYLSKLWQQNMKHKQDNE